MYSDGILELQIPSAGSLSVAAFSSSTIRVRSIKMVIKDLCVANENPSLLLSAGRGCFFSNMFTSLSLELADGFDNNVVFCRKIQTDGIVVRFAGWKSRKCRQFSYSTCDV